MIKRMRQYQAVHGVHVVVCGATGGKEKKSNTRRRRGIQTATRKLKDVMGEETVGNNMGIKTKVVRTQPLQINVCFTRHASKAKCWHQSDVAVNKNVCMV